MCGCIHKKVLLRPQGMAIGYLLGKIHGSGVYSTIPGEKRWFLGEGLVFPSWVKLPKNICFFDREYDSYMMIHRILGHPSFRQFFFQNIPDVLSQCNRVNC